jgi:hypothetical protein
MNEKGILFIPLILFILSKTMAARIIHARNEFQFDTVRLLLSEYREATLAMAEAAGACG